MSEWQTQTAALTESWEPTAEDVELLHKVILKAQAEPQATERDSLITAYQSICNKEGFNTNQDDLCSWLLSQIAGPGIEGGTLYEKFEQVLRSKKIHLVFEDEASTEASPTKQDGIRSLQPSVRFDGASAQSHDSSQGPLSDDGNYQADHFWHNVRHDISGDESPQTERLMQTAVARDRNTLLRQCIVQLQSQLRHNNLYVMENHADMIYSQRLKFKVLSHWHNVQQQQQAEMKARAADEFHLKHKAFGVLRKLLDSARVNRVQAMEEERLRGMSLYKMTMANREVFFNHQLEDSLKRTYLKRLFQSSRNISAHNSELESIAEQVELQKNLRLVRRALNATIHTSHGVQAKDSFASSHCDTKLKTTSLQRLMGKQHQMNQLNQAADDARALYLIKICFAALQNAAHIRIALARRYFDKWRKNTKLAKRNRYEALCREYRRNRKMQTARRILHNISTKAQSMVQQQQIADRHRTAELDRHAHDVVVIWYNRSQQLKRLDTAAAEHADTMVLKRALSAVTDKQRQNAQLDRIADQYRDIHDQGVSTRCFKLMSRKAFELRRRQQDAHAFQGRHDKQMVRTYLDQWRRKIAGNRGEGPLVLPPATPAQRRADQLNRLASTTPLFAPRTSFAARLRGEGMVSEIEEEDEDDDG